MNGGAPLRRLRNHIVPSVPRPPRVAPAPPRIAAACGVMCTTRRAHRARKERAGEAVRRRGTCQKRHRLRNRTVPSVPLPPRVASAPPRIAAACGLMCTTRRAHRARRKRAVAAARRRGTCQKHHRFRNRTVRERPATAARRARAAAHRGRMRLDVYHQAHTSRASENAR